MTHRSQLDVRAEIPTDFTSHLAERLQLAPDAVLTHLGSWLMHYPRAQRQSPGLATARVKPNDVCVQASAG